MKYCERLNSYSFSQLDFERNEKLFMGLLIHTNPWKYQTCIGRKNKPKDPFQTMSSHVKVTKIAKKFEIAKIATFPKKMYYLFVSFSDYSSLVHFIVIRVKLF